MDAKPQPLLSAAELARRGTFRFPGESAQYRSARTALLTEEIDLRRHIERVAEQRRALPPGGAAPGDYRFEGEAGPVDLAGLFGDKDTLVIYSFMFGPQRERACPMCTALLGPLDRNARDIEQNVALAVVVRSPLARLTAFGKERGWTSLRLFSDVSGAFSRDYHAVEADGSENGGFHVFTRKDGAIRHFVSDEMTGDMADPGQDQRGAPDLVPIWNVLDMTPRGRAPDWYPKLSYGS
ncbi:MAG: DUF899 family protein [Caulobacteraceae bacterium]